MLTYSNAYAEIDLGALADNYKKIAEYAHPAEIIAVVKADAYGHGVERCSHALYNCGCRFFAVATANEALQMRRLFSDCEILILGNTPNVELANILSDNDIIITLGSLEYAKRLEQELSNGRKLRCHIKLDTGMNRIGFSTRDEDFSELASVFDVKGLEIEGLFSHFACSDMPGSPMTDEQLESAHAIMGVIFPDQIAKTRNLEWLQLNSAGYDAFVKPGVLPESVLLTNASGAYGLAVGEHMLALTFALIRHIPKYRDAQRQNDWIHGCPVLSVEGAVIAVRR